MTVQLRPFTRERLGPTRWFVCMVAAMLAIGMLVIAVLSVLNVAKDARVPIAVVAAVVVWAVVSTVLSKPPRTED